MRILILGGAGMLGHKAYQVLSAHFDTYVTFREAGEQWARQPPYDGAEGGRVLGGVNALDLNSVSQAIEQAQPRAVLNCIGIVKQRDEAKQAIPSILTNALFPHQLAELCEACGIRLIHLSTDCVFSGARGHYTETDNPDPVDLYGRTKLLGELDRRGGLTLRTSIIGWELQHRAGLLEWFAAQRGRTIKGYQQAIYTGLSTSVLAELIADILGGQNNLTGLYHVASNPISKYDLLLGLRNTLGWQDIVIEPDEQFYCDRSLTGARFATATQWQAPKWQAMIEGLAAEWPVYEQRRSLN